MLQRNSESHFSSTIMKGLKRKEKLHRSKVILLARVSKWKLKSIRRALSSQFSLANNSCCYASKLWIAAHEHQFWGSSMMTLSSFLTKFRLCRDKLIKIKENNLPGLLSTPPEKYGKFVKRNFGMKNKIGRFSWTTL